MVLIEQKNGNVFVLGLSGKIDIEGANVFMDKIKQILDSGERYILLDFTDVTYINSSGLRALVLAEKGLAASAGKLVLAGVSDPIQKVLRMTGLAASFTLRPTREESLELFPQ